MSPFAPDSAHLLMLLQCEPSLPIPGDVVDNDCDGSIDEEKKDGIDNDGDGKVDEDLSLVICTD